MTTLTRMTPERLADIRDAANSNWRPTSIGAAAWQHRCVDLLAHIDAIEAERRDEVERMTRERDEARITAAKMERTVHMNLATYERRVPVPESDALRVRAEAAESARDTALAQLAALRSAAEAVACLTDDGDGSWYYRTLRLATLRTALADTATAAREHEEAVRRDERAKVERVVVEFLSPELPPTARAHHFPSPSVMDAIVAYGKRERAEGRAEGEAGRTTTAAALAALRDYPDADLSKLWVPAEQAVEYHQAWRRDLAKARANDVKTAAALRAVAEDAASEGAQAAKAVCEKNGGEWPTEECEFCDGGTVDEGEDCDDCNGAGFEYAPASPMTDALPFDEIIARHTTALSPPTPTQADGGAVEPSQAVPGAVEVQNVEAWAHALLDAWCLPMQRPRSAELDAHVRDILAHVGPPPIDRELALALTADEVERLTRERNEARMLAQGLTGKVAEYERRAEYNAELVTEARGMLAALRSAAGSARCAIGDVSRPPGGCTLRDERGARCVLVDDHGDECRFRSYVSTTDAKELLDAALADTASAAREHDEAMRAEGREQADRVVVEFLSAELPATARVHHFPSLMVMDAIVAYGKRERAEGHAAGFAEAKERAAKRCDAFASRWLADADALVLAAHRALFRERAHVVAECLDAIRALTPEQSSAPVQDPGGSSRCPLCGEDTPHYHPSAYPVCTECHGSGYLYGPPSGDSDGPCFKCNASGRGPDDPDRSMLLGHGESPRVRSERERVYAASSAPVQSPADREAAARAAGAPVDLGSVERRATTEVVDRDLLVACMRFGLERGHAGGAAGLPLADAPNARSLVDAFLAERAR